MFKKAVLLSCLVGAISAMSVGPAAAWEPSWSLGCQGYLHEQNGPTWDLGPECSAVEDPARAVLGSAADYADAQAYAVCNFVDGTDPNTIDVDCSLFEPDDQ